MDWWREAGVEWAAGIYGWVWGRVCPRKAEPPEWRGGFCRLADSGVDAGPAKRARMKRLALVFDKFRIFRRW